MICHRCHKVHHLNMGPQRAPVCLNCWEKIQRIKEKDREREEELNSRAWINYMITRHNKP